MKLIQRILSWFRQDEVNFRHGARVVVRLHDGTICHGSFRGRDISGCLCVVVDQDPTRLHLFNPNRVKPETSSAKTK